MTNPILSSLEVALLHELAPAPLWVGYSGGLDSTVLLHWLTTQYPVDRITAVHINHQLHPAANDWQAHAQQFCQHLGVNWQCQTVQVSTDAGQSLEEAARIARYEAFASQVPPGGHLLLAHHRQDQLETMLLQLLRGSGVQGLAAMPTIRCWRQRSVHRLMLTVSRADILHYAQTHQLHWIEDATNHDLTFARNQLRHQLIPMMQRYWPGAEQTITRSAHLCGEAAELLQDLAALDYAGCQHFNRHQLLITPLRRLSPARQRNVLRYWIAQLGYRAPNYDKLIALQTDLLLARLDANPIVRWGTVEVRRYRDILFVHPLLSPIDTSEYWQWDLTQPLKLPGTLGQLTAIQVAADQPLGTDLPMGETQVTVRLRQGGESCYLPGRAGRRSLKKLFQTWGIPPWQRDRLPLIFYQDQLIGIPGWLSGQLPIKPQTVTRWQWVWTCELSS
ncbi:MAG: tRNA lysidine(34) synthetase TilS [Legionellales bacterium]|nr:tRNA lysidine(34) synthetase TilS [Legionellales bacterium]